MLLTTRELYSLLLFSRSIEVRKKTFRTSCETVTGNLVNVQIEVIFLALDYNNGK